MILPFEILQRLKCSECLLYLSCGPVFMSDSGCNICGRCSVLEFADRHRFVPKIRSSLSVGIPHAASAPPSRSDSNEAVEKSVYVNSIYNEVAVLFEFPCRYESNGCMEKIYFADVKEHEQNCIFRQVECPVDEHCDWIGPINKISPHVGENHPTKLLQRPCILEHDMAQASTQYYVTSIQEELFVIKVKITLITPTVYYSLCKVGTIDDNVIYKYSLKVESKSENVIRKGDINEQSSLTDDDISVAINMTQIVASKHYNTRFTLEIDKFIKCHKCRRMKGAEEIEVFDKSNYVYYCTTCLSTLSPCKNSQLGCIWRGVTGYKFNHEALFCSFTKWCEVCDETITENNMLHHMRKRNHHLHKISHLRQKFGRISSDNDNNDQYFFTLNASNTSYMIICKRQDSFCYKFMLFGKHQNIKKMKCFLSLRNIKSRYISNYCMKSAFSSNCGQFVWIQYVDKPKLTAFADENGFEFNVEIYNTDDE